MRRKAGTLTIDGAAMPAVPIDTVFGRTGNVVAVSGDYSADQIDYDNLVSGLSASDVKAALDELAAIKTDKKLSLNEQSGTSYTFVLGDAEGYVRFDNAAAISVTVPNNSSAAYDIGTVITARQVGAGQVVIVADSGVTINTPQTLKLSGIGAVVSLVKVSTNTWDLFGDLELAP